MACTATQATAKMLSQPRKSLAPVTENPNRLFPASALTMTLTSYQSFDECTNVTPATCIDYSATAFNLAANAFNLAAV